MKLSILFVVLGVSLFLISWVNAREIGFIEDFSLADDRSEALRQLIPGTSDYYYYHCLHAQHVGDADQVEKMVELWIQREGYTPQVQEILNRQALLSYEKYPKKSLEHIRKELSLRFDHQKEIASRKTDHPTELDPSLISIPRLMDRAFSQYQNLQGVEDAGLDVLAHEKLNQERRRDLLNRLRRPDIPNLPKLVKEDLRHKNSSGFGSLSIHQHLLKSQLDKCLDLMPELLDSSEFVNTYLSKLSPGDDVDIRYDLEEKKAYLERLWGFVEKLAPAHNSLKAYVLYQILDMNRREGHYDHKRFMEYIRLPRNIHYMNPNYLTHKKLRHVQADLNAEFSGLAITISSIGTDEALVRDYLSHFFVTAKNYKEYAKFIRDTYLRPLFAETKILNGIGDMEQWYSMMEPAEYQRLRDRADIDFTPDNRKYFATDDPVRLDLHVKNVTTLIVKVFELNTFNYYQSNLREIDTAVNLDGLTATWEEIIRYDEPPSRRVCRSFDFPQISKPGVFVAEFIGNGKSSRALVRKGRLYVTEKIGPAGHEFMVRNEENEKCPKASIWMSGREFKPGDDATIIIPFTSNPGKQSMILRNGDFSSLASFEHLPEDYEFAAGFYADRESLIRGAKAKVLVRPMLTLNGHPASLSLLENVRLEIACKDHEGVSATKEIADFELSEDKESVYEFQVPDNLASLSLTLKTQVRNMSRNKRENLIAAKDFQINQTDHSLNVEDVFLSHADGSYMLNVLGKNGEAKANRAVNLELRHRFFREPIAQTLQSNEKGHICLGKLEGIKSLSAKTESMSRTWNLPKDQCRYPGNIHTSGKEQIRIPYVGASQGESRLHYVLLEKRGQTYFEDRSDAITHHKGFLEISGLPSGDYELFLKDDGKKISICLTEGPAEEGFVISGNRILETKNEVPLQITDIRTEDSAVCIALENFSEFTRVHVFATRFMPEFSAFAHLLDSNSPEPYQIRQTKAESQYIAGRNIGDEYRYILERKYAEKFPGNMLDRPELLLNPWSIRKTQTATDKAKAGESYAAVAPPPTPAKEMMNKAAYGKSPGKAALSSNLDFLAQSSAVLVNLRPDENGVIRIDRKHLGNHQQLHFLAADLADTVYREVSLPEKDMKTRDLRLARSFDAEKHLTEQKRISLISPNETFQTENIGTSDFEVYDSLAKAYQLLATLNSNETLREFAFILRWPKMDAVEKQDKYSEYACHELNFFLYHKDKTFFDDVVLPCLRNKKDKTFLDRWLISDVLDEYLKPWAYSQLNIVEKILLSRRGPGDKDQMSAYVRDLFDMIPPDTEKDNRLFDTALRGRMLEKDESLPQLRAASGSLMAYADETEGDGAESDLDLELDMSPREEKADRSAPVALVMEKKTRRKAPPPRRQNERKQMRQFFQKLDKTEEWAENNYYKLPIEKQTADLVTVNAFWNDYAQSDPGQPFLSKNFACAHRNFSEMMLALSVLDLPFEQGSHETSTQGATLSLTAASPVIVFHKEIRESRAAQDKTPIMVSQHFFDPADRFFHEGNRRFDKYVEDDFLLGKAYGCMVVVSNPISSAPQKLTALLQIPSGAMPLGKGLCTKSLLFQMKPYVTKKIEYRFYFPEAGRFQHYPVQIFKNEEFLSAASASELNVVRELSKTDTASWDYVSQNGSEDEVLEFLRTHNLNRPDLDKIAFRMKDGKFFEVLISLLEGRHFYQHTLWSYGVYHNDPKRISEFLRHSPYAEQCGTYIRTPLLAIDPVERKRYQHFEYRPLVNARVHRLGKDRKLLNDRFHRQYEQFMRYLSYRPRLTDDDLTALVYYLLLQDRIAEAMSFFERIDRDKLETKIQYDYLRAYLDFYTENFDSAKGIAAKYADYPVPRWKKLFRHVAEQLAEAEGKSSEVTDEQSRDQIHAKLADTESGFEFKVESDQIRISYQNLDSCRVSYYPMDIELLFSRTPFMQKQSEHFAFIRPNASDEITLSPNETQLSLDLPEEFRNANLMVEITARGLRKFQAYYANALDVQIIENYGHLRVRHGQTLEMLPKVYVKVYARMRQGGSVQFFKDGYTDLRGRFDYVSLSTDELDRVERFAILILSEAYGAAIREAAPPKR